MNTSESSEQGLLSLIEKGVENSASKLAALSHADWDTQTVSIKTASVSMIQDSMLRDDKDQFGAYFTMPGGVFLVMFPVRSGAAFADIFLPSGEKHQNAIKNREQESMAEISNVVVNAVAASIADACDTAFFLSAPQMSQGKKKDLLQAAPDMIQTPGEKFAVMAYVHMSSAALSSDCTVVLLLSASWRKRLLEALG